MRKNSLDHRIGHAREKLDSSTQIRWRVATVVQPRHGAEQRLTPRVVVQERFPTYFPCTFQQGFDSVFARVDTCAAITC